MDLEVAVRQAKARDLEAFAEITRRFQHMAFGYALSFVRDPSHAEDIVQEAFVAAWFALPTLAEPAAFPGWLRTIVRHQAHRVVRRKRPEVALATVESLPSEEAPPDGRIELRQRVGAVLAAVAGLPRPLREIVTLFYVHECSQQDIATFLGLPVTTVNNRLHAARTQLKRRTLTMVKDTLEAHQLPDDFAARIGRIVRARGSVIEARFDPANPPGVMMELTLSDEARQQAIPVQVMQRLGDGVVRGVAITPVEALRPGMTLLSSGRHSETPVSGAAFEQIVRVLGRSAQEPTRGGTLVETGIKVIDVTCPLVGRGTVAIAGEWAAGTVVVVEELVRRLASGADTVSIFTIAPGPRGTSFEEVWKKEGYSEGTVGAVETFFLRGEDGPWTPERLATLTGVDVVIRLSQELGRLGIWPAVDPLASRSRLLDPRIVSAEHAEITARVRQALAALVAGASHPDAVPERTLERARKLQRFFAQPFYCTEPYTHRPGVTVSLAESLRGCREILDGVHDEVPMEVFYFTGGFDEIRARAGKA